MSFAASDSTSTWQGGIKEREDGEKVWGDDYSRKAINQGTAIIRGISIVPWLHVLSKNENIINAGYWFPASRGLSLFLSFLPRRQRRLLQPVAKMLRHSHLSCSNHCWSQILRDIILISLVPPIQSCSSKFWAWSCIASNFYKGWRGDHKHKIEDRPFMPNYGVVSQVLLQLVVAGKVLGTFWKSEKLILSGKNQWVVIAKISFRKTEKITNAQKMNSRKNFVPHGMPT